MTPFPHQVEAVRWLVDAPGRVGPHAMPASDPGLGKTIIGIGGADEIAASRILTLCPPVMRLKWVEEILRWQGFPRPVTMLDTARLVAAYGKQKPRAAEWVVLGWQHAHDAQEAWKASIKFDLLILDEAHYAKSPQAARTRAVYGYGCKGGGLSARVKRVWPMTGTPVLNGPHELWSHYRALWPHALGTERPYSYAGFVNEFCDVAPTSVGNVVRGVKKGKADLLRQAFAPYVLRQRKVEVMSGMPALRVSEVPLLIGAKEKAEVRALAAERGLFDATLAQVEEALGEADATHLATLRRLLGAAKAKAAADLIAADMDGGTESAVVFAWHRDTLDALERALAPFGVLRLDGAVDAGERSRRVARFQGGGSERIILGQITAAGVGLTLTRASDVYLVEQAWTPAENAQAIQRCHRIGQTAPVLARFLYAEGTIDAAIAAVLARKAKTLLDLGMD